MCDLNNDSVTEDPFDYQVLNLSNKFYEDYPDPPFHEIVRKDNRPYNCLLIQSHYGYFICIPYRSYIRHKYAFKFKHSKRSKRALSGLDYTKIVIINNSDYLCSSDAVVDQDEYNETRENIEFIRNDAQKFVDDYVSHLANLSDKYNEKQFGRVYGFSTLKYFHNELNIIKDTP